MRKLFCDNCNAELGETSYGPGHQTIVERYVLKPSNIAIGLSLVVSQGAQTNALPDLCMNCFLAALHGAFKQPEATA